MKTLRLLAATATLFLLAQCAVTGSLEYETADGKSVKIGQGSDGKTSIDVRAKEVR